jgi:hypothetical protein
MMAAKTATRITFIVSTNDEPTLREAVNASPQDRELWLKAIKEEFEALEDKGTWVPDVHSRRQALLTHIILKVKHDTAGNVVRFKARIVACNNHQRYGEEYFETYAPVVDFALVRAFLYLAVCNNMRMAQINVKTAFLNGELDECVWVMSPRGIPGHTATKHKLAKSLYGLKQAHMEWHRKLVSDLMVLDFAEIQSTPCVFMRKTP